MRDIVRQMFVKADQRSIGREQLQRVTGQRIGRGVVMLAMYALLIFLSFVLLYPILFAISQAFRTQADIYNENVIWIPTEFTLNNFRLLWERIDYPVLFRNTILIAVGSSVLQTATCAVTGYGFARFRFKEKGIWFALLLLTVILPPQIVSIPNYFLYKDFDMLGILSLVEGITGVDIQIRLLDSLGVYFLPAVFGQGMRSGLFILIFWQFFRGLPQELEDASQVDGAGAVKTFMRVMLPNCRSAIVVVLLFSIVWYWNDTYTANMFMENMETISMRLALINSDVTSLGLYLDRLTQTPFIQAGVLISISPLLILYIVCQRVFVESVERAGIVG